MSLAPTTRAALAAQDAPVWDTEARRVAYDQSRHLRDSLDGDPEAAAVLTLALERQSAPTLAPTQPQRPGAVAPPTGPRTREGYNPPALYAQMVDAHHWTLRDCDECHFPAFFGLLRELTLLQERQERESEARLEAARRGQHLSAPGAAASASVGAGLLPGTGSITDDHDLAALLAHVRRPARWDADDHLPPPIPVPVPGPGPGSVR